MCALPCGLIWSSQMPSNKKSKPIDIQRCEARALQCEREAERANQPELKVIFRDLAQAWRNAAHDIANNRPLASTRRRRGKENDKVA
jgi:hypothetical protein